MLGWLVGGIVIFYTGFVGLLYFLQERMLYFPTRHLIATPQDIDLPYEQVWLETEDGKKLFGWFVPAPDSNRVLLFFHGNGGNISHRLDSIEQFNRLGLNVLIIDYRGYGQSDGATNEAGTYRDAMAAWYHLTVTRRFEPEQIVIFGRSLGGGVAAWLAQQHPPGALILESTFTSVPDIAQSRFPLVPVQQLSRLQYNTKERLPQMSTPVLIIHSPEDEIVPFSHSQKLYEVAQEPKEFLQINGGHNDGFLLSGVLYEQTVTTFIDQHLAE